MLKYNCRRSILAIVGIDKIWSILATVGIDKIWSILATVGIEKTLLRLKKGFLNKKRREYGR
nr:hypothetical protein [Listeria monocytogenes]